MAEYRTLRAGVFLPPFHPNDEDPLLCMERDFQLMQWLDIHNYAEAWIGEHHSGGYEIYGQPELFIASAAERTRQIRLGTGVISLAYHHPFMVADRIVQLDYQTRGRAMFGLGPGLLPSDAMMLGIDPETQRDRMADAIDIITRLLDGETITQQSEWYAMREARLHLRPYSKPEAASGDRQRGDAVWWQARRALRPRHAVRDGGQSERLRHARLQLGTRQRRGGGAGPGHGSRQLSRYGAIPHCRDPREGDRECARRLREVAALFIFGKPRGRRCDRHAKHRGDQRGRARRIGTPDDALRVLENYWAKTGGFGCILMLAHDWADWEATKRS
jgi:limonene 1,2-monooxygenase